jgi:hypothetical protein
MGASGQGMWSQCMFSMLTISYSWEQDFVLYLAANKVRFECHITCFAVGCVSPGIWWQTLAFCLNFQGGSMGFASDGCFFDKYWVML